MTTTPTVWKPLAAAVAFVVAGLWIERAVFGSVDDFLKDVKSEVVVGSILEPLPADAIAAAAAMEAAARVAAETRPVNAFRGPVAAAETRPVSAAAPPRREGPNELLRRLMGYFGLLSANTRTTNDAYYAAPAIDIAPTYSAFDLNSVVIDPVDPVTGEMHFTYPVVRVPGTGLDYAFALSYRSGYTYDGPVGSRWEHNWNARFYYSSASTSTLYRYAGNRKDAYVESSSGSNSFLSPKGFFEHGVTRTTSGTAKIERLLQDGTLETYENLDQTNEANWYFLTSVKHRDRDNAIALTYDGTERLTKITDTRGREFRLSYNGGNRVAELADHSSGDEAADRTWSFAYDDAGLLLSVTAPGSPAPVTQFTYSGTALLASVKAPREVAASGSAYLSMTYDGSYRVTAQTYGVSGQAYAMTYDLDNDKTTEVDREGVSRIYYYDANNAITKVRQGVSGGYDDTLYAWDGTTALMTKSVQPAGNGALYQYTNGQLVASSQSTSTGLSSPPGNLSTTSSGADHLVTVYTYQTASDWRLLTKIKDPRGNEWQLDRDGTGNVTGYKTPTYPSNGWTLTYDSRSRLITAADPEGRTKALDYGATGLLTKVSVDPAGLDLETVFARDQYGNVTKVTDPRAKETTLVRNVRGYVTSVTTPEGRVTDYDYDLNGLVTKVSRDVGYSSSYNAERWTVYTYTILDLVSMVDQQYGSSHGSSRVTEYDFDKEDRITLVKLPRGNQIKTVYDTRGLAVTKTVADGEAYASSEIMAYDTNGRLVSAKNGLGQETTFAYDAFDRQVTMTDPAGHYRTTSYDYGGNVTETAAFKSGGGTSLAKTTLEFDQNNRLTKRSQWAKKADLSTSIGSGNIDASYVYDKGDLLTQKSDPCGSCGGGSGGTTAYVYDAAGRLSKTTPALGGYSIALRDANGQVTKVSQYEIYSGTTKTYVVEHEYDGDRALTKTKEKGGGSDTALTTTYVVDGFGAVREITDPNGNIAKHVYDDLGRHVTALRAAGTGYELATYTVYDANDNVLTRTCEKGATDTHVRYEYDQADRVTKHFDEAGSDPEIFAYDKGHRVTLRTDRNGNTSTNTYDSRGLLTTKTYALTYADVIGPTQVTFAYDGLGRVTKAYNGDALVQRTWNSLSCVETESNWIAPTNDSGASSTQRDVAYTYDPDGRVTLVTYPDSALKVSRVYDALGRMQKLYRQDYGTGSWTKTAEWTFSGPSRMTKLELGSDRTTETLAYDQYGRATRLSWDRVKDSTRYDPMLDFRRAYDAGGRVTSERRDYADAASTTTPPALLDGNRDFGDLYRYDPADRLTKVVRGVGFGAGSNGHDDVETAADTTTDYVSKTVYTLDGGGNRLSLVYDVPGTASVKQELHTFDAQNQLLTRLEIANGVTTTKTNEFDANGAQTKGRENGSVRTLDAKLDMEGRLYEAKDYGSSDGSLSFRYLYDPFGRRVERKEITSGTSTLWTRTYFDGVQPISEVVVVAAVSPSTTPTETRAKFLRIYGPYLVDQILWARGDLFGLGSSYFYEGYYQGDYLGTVQGIISDIATNISIAGGVLETYRYTEYGEVTFSTGRGVYASVSAGEQDFTYTGREWTTELGAHYFRARHLSPILGSFASRDGLASEEGSFSYNYADGSPVNNIDPFGLQASAAIDLINTLNSPIFAAPAGARRAHSARNPDGKGDKSKTVHCSFRGSRSTGLGVVCCATANGSDMWCCDAFSGHTGGTGFGAPVPEGTYLLGYQSKVVYRHMYRLRMGEDGFDTSDYFPYEFPFNDDGTPGKPGKDPYKPEKGRNVINFHYGTRSDGCVTVPDKDCWNKLQELMKRGDGAPVPPGERAPRGMSGGVGTITVTHTP